MSYESRAYDKPNDGGFPSDPVVVLVVEGTHDVSRLIGLLRSGQPLIEHMKVANYILGQVRRRNAGREALKLLAAHGGPDLLGKVPAEDPELRERVAEAMADANVEPGYWQHLTRRSPNPDGYTRQIYANNERTCETYRTAADAAIEFLASHR